MLSYGKKVGKQKGWILWIRFYLPFGEKLSFSELENIPILDNQCEKVDNFVDTLLYYFQYREYSAKNIEIMILAFQAGRGYQYSVDHQ